MASLAAVVRWREWHDSKLMLFLVAICYAVLRQPAPGLAQLRTAAALLAVLSFYAAFGHVINDYADRAADRAAGKPKLLAAWSEPAALAAVTIPALGTAIIAAVTFNTATVALTFAALLLAAIYSLPPLRLKERDLLGWAAAAAAQRTLPIAIVFQAFGAWDAVAIGLTVLNTLIGLRFIIVHQLLDRTNDQRTGVRTVATQHRPQPLVALLRLLFVPEIACACLCMVAMCRIAPWLGIAALAYTGGLAIALRRGRTISPLTYFVFGGFYHAVWPIALALLLAWRNPWFLAIAAIAAALVQRQARSSFRAAFLTPAASGASAQTPAFASASRGAVNLGLDKADPYPHYARLRATAAVVRVDWPGLGPNWLVTRHQEALTVLRDARFIRDADRLQAIGVRTNRPPTRGFGRDMMEVDPPDHTRLRKLVALAFTPRMIRRFEPRIEQLAGKILDSAAQSGEIELIADYASVIPVVTILELLGLPADNMHSMRELLFTLADNNLTGQGGSAVELQKQRFTAALEAEFAARRTHPRDDLLTALVQAEQDGDRLSADELIGMVYLLLLAGFMTTVNLIGNGTLALMRHPEQLELLRRDAALTASAVEELLRFDSPLELSPVCYAAIDVELGGRTIPRGAPVRVLIPAVNRDERAFTAPDRLDITRDPCPHLSFGQGIHHCLGAPLARLEGRVALRTLVERAPALRLADGAQVTWLPHPILRGLRQLPLRI